MGERLYPGDSPRSTTTGGPHRRRWRRARRTSRSSSTTGRSATDLAHPSTSITNDMEFLAPEAIRRFCPERFEHEEVAVLLEHDSEERDGRGRLGRRATWDRVSFASWAPCRVWFGGQERLSLGEPAWRPLPVAEVAALIGKNESQG